eukprot:g8023.t1
MGALGNSAELEAELIKRNREIAKVRDEVIKLERRLHEASLRNDDLLEKVSVLDSEVTKKTTLLTESEQKDTCLKHFSNEYTLPLAGVFMKLGRCLETNRCCRRCGSAGTLWGKRHRRCLMVTSFWISFVAWLLNIYAVLALSSSPEVVKATAWAKGKISFSGKYGGADSWVGLGGRVDEVNCGLSDYTDSCNAWFRANATKMKEISPGIFQRHVDFKDKRSCPQSIVFTGGHKFGDLIEEVVGFDVEASQEMCQSCLDSAASTISFAVMGAITQIPQMTTDLQRATRFGDVNCQATMGAITSFWGTYSGISSLASFSYQCWRRFPRYVRERNGVLDFSWSMGPGFLCMLIATILKLWDAMAHFILPTPNARHTKPPKECDDIYDYMIMAYDVPDSEIDETSESGSDNA